MHCFKAIDTNMSVFSRGQNLAMHGPCVKAGNSVFKFWEGRATCVLDFLFFRIIKSIKAEYLYFYRHWTHFGNAQSSHFRCKEIRVCGMNNPVCAVVPGIEHYRIVSIHCFSSLSCSSQIWNTQTHLARSSFPSSFIRAQSDLA